MEIEDGVIWVYAVGEDGVQAFTDFGIENLINPRNSGNRVTCILQELRSLIKRTKRDNYFGRTVE
jgi:hypothetical protein